MHEFSRLFDLPRYQLAQYPKPDSLNEKREGKWISYSTQQVIDAMDKVSKALLASGIRPGDKVAIVGNNCPQWNFADLGIMQIGAVTVPLYPTISDDDYVYILNHSEARLLFVSSAELYHRLYALRSRMPQLQELITFRPVPGAVSWDEFLQRGNTVSEQQLQQLREAVQPTDLACIIYTSGTTGFPKGVMLSHRNVVENLKSVGKILPINNTHVALSFLPLNHVFEKLVVYFYLMKGVSCYYAESMDTIGDNMREVRPHFFTAVPRLLEKVYERIMSKGHELKGLKRKLFFWAVRLGERWENGKKMGWWYMLQLKVARKLIFSKWLQALGGRVFLICSGAAPLNPKIGAVFTAAGITIIEGYGLTETAPVLTVNRVNLDENVLGTVGKPIPGVEIKLDADGEILARGPNIMLGYYKMPQETAEVMTPDGWFRTGDIGEWVRGEFLKITDRKKELFKTSGGKLIAPLPIENHFKQSPFIEQFLLVGDNRKFISALIVPSFANLKKWCEQNQVEWTTAEEMVKHPLVLRKYEEIVNELNRSLGHVEQVKKFTLLPREWTVLEGLMTPTLKPRRKEILARFAAEVEQMYAE
ncbi:MAG: long-chain fatty acid--CoA ligase [Chitinophagales bacterium]|nr:long-chain fatty acid--CoA ligase [Chitinophagales bacterium]MDW8426957.1 long-chain fatty acid--CoA ligase [Chitinophagales bacterium]